MKRIRIWIESFSLSQQFIAVVLLIVATFTFFTLTFTKNNAETIVDKQMFSIIHNEQKDILTRNNNYIGNVANHYLYDANYPDAFSEISELELIIQNIPFESIDDILDTIVDVNGKSIVCSVLRINESSYLISIGNNAYKEGLTSAFSSTAISISIIAAFSLFIILALWVISLIKPLNQIKNYINAIKDGDKDADIKVNRRDEIGDVAYALKSMNNELSKQQRIREEMIQNISHDLKTPIATIKSYSESIKDGVYPYGTLEKSVDVITEHATRLEKKVYSLINLNKYGYLTDVDPKSEVLMNDIITKAIISCAILRNDISIETNLENNIMFHGEEDPWRITIENLIDNALRYAQTKVVITLTKNKLSVFNDGELMDKDRIEKLFKPYEKGTNGNFGLGLSIVKRICDTYGYTINGENTNNGVIFTIFKKKNTK